MYENVSSKYKREKEGESFSVEDRFYVVAIGRDDLRLIRYQAWALASSSFSLVIIASNN